MATSTTSDGTTLTLTCSGCAETEALESLSATLKEIHEDVVRASMRTVVADVRGLEFASSSCLKAFVTWLQRVQELDEQQRYEIRFRSNPSHSWQRRSLGALAAFASGVVSIEMETR